jgi:hypothetical protein
MANNPATHGRYSRLFMSADATGAMSQVGMITDWTLDMATDKVETTALGDDNKTYVQGLKDIKGTLTANWDSLDDAMFLAADAPSGIKMAIYPTQDDGTYWAGPAWLDVSIKGGVSVALTLDGTFTANGSWTHAFAAPGGLAARRAA